MIGTKNFPEEYILGELYKQALEAKGFKVLAPAYPGFEVEVEALNADPTPVEQLTVPMIIDSLESLIATLDTPPILMAHSAGGSFTQVLLDHGHGAAGVVMNSAPTEGVRVTPAAQVRAGWPVGAVWQAWRVWLGCWVWECRSYPRA